jgi:TolB-like protein
MMKCFTFPISVFLLTQLAWASHRPPRIWILPFDNRQADLSLDYLVEALPALLAVAVSQSEEHAVVDRQHMKQVMAEQSLTLEGLTSQSARLRVGRLLGATVMISGGFVRDEPDLLITMQATDVETGIIMAAGEVRGAPSQLGQVMGRLYRKLAMDLGSRLPDLHANQIDEAPLSNLHFMRGLGYYYSARYNQAIAQFMQALEEENSSSLPSLSRLWLANAYLAQQQYGHAYLELSRIGPGGWKNLRRDEVEAKLRVCEKNLRTEELKLIRELVVPRESE